MVTYLDQAHHSSLSRSILPKLISFCDTNEMGNVEGVSFSNYNNEASSGCTFRYI